jgi:hypothetical protein
MDPYDPGKRGEKYVTVTTLCNPPQLTKLFWQHQHELSEDASERIWSLLGQSVHSVIERAAASERTDHCLAEVRHYAEIDGWTIGGQCDLYDTLKRHVVDFKITSVWSAKGDIKTSWNRQLNLLAWLLRKNGYQVDSAEIVAILRDWSRTKATYDKDYPERAVTRIEAKFVSDEVIEKFIRSQLAELEKDEPRDCQDEERWKRGGEFAVMKDDKTKWAVVRVGAARAIKVYDSQRDALLHIDGDASLTVERRDEAGSKRAVRLFPSLLEAEEYVANHAEEKLRVEFREAEYMRCAAYCPVRHHCRQAQSDGVVFA